MKNKNGITIIALVITIIVLLILAGVSIATLTGDNGLLTKTWEAKNTTEEAEIEEQIELAYLQYEEVKYKDSDETLEKAMKSTLENIFNETITIEKIGEDIKITFTDSNKIYKCYSNGKIKKLIEPTEQVYGKLDKDSKILYLRTTNKEEYSIFNKTTSNYYQISTQYDTSEISKVIIEEPISLTNANSLFSNCSNMVEIINIENLHTYNVENMSKMFYGCNSLANLDLSDFDTSNVKYMNQMFYSCTSLTELDLDGFYTSNVENMTGMFSGCNSLTKLDLSDFDTKNVKQMIQMFINCTSLTELDLSSFDTNNVENINTMFCSCSKLAELNLGKNFIIKNDTNANSMFLYANFHIKIKTTQDTANKIKEIRTDYTDNNFEIIN